MAAFLFVAAVLKLWGVVTGVLTVSGLELPTWFTVAVALVEGWVAWQLVVNSSRALALFAALSLFLAFEGFAVFRWFTGANGCGCYGAIDMPPAVAALIDLGCLIGLWLKRPMDFAKEISREVRILKYRLVSGRALPALVTGVFVFISAPCLLGTGFGRALVGLPALSCIVASTSQVAAGEPDSWVSGRVLLTNTSHVLARIVGANATCGCVGVTSLPESIPANGEVSIEFRLLRPRKPGAFRKLLTIYLDHPDQYLVQVAVGGQAVLAE